jgi:hypothetical protein
MTNKIEAAKAAPMEPNMANVVHPITGERSTENHRRMGVLLQGGKCDCCGKALTWRKAVSDHDHSNGAPRGALCAPCNGFVGHYENHGPRATLAEIMKRHPQSAGRHRQAPSRDNAAVRGGAEG